jgi:hypothetical protein
MKRAILIATVAALIFSTKATSAQSTDSTKKKYPQSFNILLNQDLNFGFYPVVTGSFGVSPTFSVTGYGILWTNPVYNARPNGEGTLTEFGAGISYFSPNEKLFVNPQLGITNGNFASSDTTGIFAEGWVPSTLVLYNSGRFELESFGTLYIPLRGNQPVTQTFAIYWILPGFKVTENLSAGLHYEGYAITKKTNANPEQLYQRWGGYVKMTFNKNYWIRFSMGADAVDKSQSGEFYKLSVSSTF